MKTFTSNLSQKKFPISERISGKSIRNSLLELIQKDCPEFTTDSLLAAEELNVYRKRYITETLTKEVGEVNELEQKVLTSFADQSTLTDKIDDGDTDNCITVGQRVADKVASFGGSWTFIISFGVFLVFWISLNAFWLANRAIDPYPFILLNLVLSCLAALQAPIIMMSQNRQEEKDRERAKKDYMINLKAELEVKTLHEKIDHLIIYQQQELMEMQNVQVEMLNDILEKFEKK